MVLKTKFRSLPIEIEANILSRLPVKTLIRFRSVRRSWYSLISEPYFVHMHRLRNQKDNLFVLITSMNIPSTKILVADTCFNELSTFEKPYCYDYYLVDSSNGLVCLYGNDIDQDSNDCDMEYISLWNPALRINKIIRHSRMSTDREDVKLCVGFGFHHQINDFKVVRFANDLVTFGIKEVEIYSLGSDSWRKINGAADSLGEYSISKQFGVYVSDAALNPNFYGAYCWIDDDSEEPMIISFDMGDEVFKEIMLPPNVSLINNEIGELSLFNYKNSLGVLNILDQPWNGDSSIYYVWVMEEYNEPKSWTRLYKFERRPLMNFTLLGTTLENELVFKMDKFILCELHVLDVDKLEINRSSTKDISILGMPRRISSFTESLVLLDKEEKKIEDPVTNDSAT